MSSFRLEGSGGDQSSEHNRVLAIGISLLMLVSTLSLVVAVPTQESMQGLTSRVPALPSAISDLIAQPTATPGYSNGNLAYLTPPAPQALNTPMYSTNFTPLTQLCLKGPGMVSFTASPKVGAPPLPVSFRAETICSGNVVWTFGNGNQSTQNSPNGSVKWGSQTLNWWNWTYTYRSAGSFVAQFSITLNGNQAGASANIYVEPAGISFQGSPEYGNPPLTVIFSYKTMGAVGYSASWKFGDGNTSTQTSPNGSVGNGPTYQWWNYTHTYHYIGAFQSQVNVTNSNHKLWATTNVYASFVPSLFYSFYNESGLLGQGYNGSFYSIGLVEGCGNTTFDNALQGNLNTFDARFHLPNTTLNLEKVDGICPAGGSTWDPNETNLDIQWAHVAAPGAKLYVCLAYSFTPSEMNSCNSWFYSNRASWGTSIVSNSWGFCAQDSSAFVNSFGCENNTDPYDGIWNQSRLAGMNLLASSGDFVPAGCWTGDYDAANPDGIAVGGTTVGSVGPGGSYGTEHVWSTRNPTTHYCISNHGVHSLIDWGETNGLSNYYQAPGWQNSALLNTTQRYFPDVGMVADPATGVPIVTLAGHWMIVGGDSIGAPVWAGILDMLLQAVAPHLSGFAGPFLYSAGALACFHDYLPGPPHRDGLGTPDVGCLAKA